AGNRRGGSWGTWALNHDRSRAVIIPREDDTSIRDPGELVRRDRIPMRPVGQLARERPVLLAVGHDDVPLVRLVPGLLLRPPGEFLAVRAELRAAVGGLVVGRQRLPLRRGVV